MSSIKVTPWNCPTCGERSHVLDREWLSARLNTLRLSQRQFARMCGRSPAWLNSILTGHREITVAIDVVLQSALTRYEGHLLRTVATSKRPARSARRPAPEPSTRRKE